MITKRDLEILIFMQENGGKTFMEVLEKTFFEGRAGAKRRIQILINDGLLKRRPTGLLKPANMIVFGENARESFYQMWGVEPKRAKLSSVMVRHEMIQQLAHYWLNKLDGTVKRTTINQDFGKFHHVPDLIWENERLGQIFFEIELNKKTNKRYLDIFTKSEKDGARNIIYILASEKDRDSYMEHLPKASILKFISIDELVHNIKTTGKINAKSQI